MNNMKTNWLKANYIYMITTILVTLGFVIIITLPPNRRSSAAETYTKACLAHNGIPNTGDHPSKWSCQK